MSKYSEACCKIPPVVDGEYQPKGKYISLNGTRTYVTGPADATKAILSVYDIFGFFPQTLQGADILAYASSQQKYQVYMPDFFDGNPCDLAWYPPDDAAKAARIAAWFPAVAAWARHLPRVPGLLAAAEAANARIRAWGVVGYCWGGKLASQLAGPETPPRFRAAVQTSPARVDPAEGEKVKIPMMVLASRDESDEEVGRYADSLTVPKHVEMFADQTHGFMSARADLKDPRVREEYERGYRLALGWFAEYL